MFTVHHLFSMFGFALGLALSLRLLRQQNRPSVTYAWLLVMALVPYVGVPLYLLFAGRKLRRRVSAKGRLTGDADVTPGVPAGLGAEIERLLVSEGLPAATTGNALQLLPDGESAYRALRRQIEGASRSIHVSTFILGRDAVGRDLVALLAARAEEGLEVRLLVDALGSLITSQLVV